MDYESEDYDASKKFLKRPNYNEKQEFGEYDDSKSRINPHTTNQSIIMDDIKDYVKQLSAEKDHMYKDR